MNDQLADVLDLDAVGQADLVRRGQVRPVELVQAAISRAEQSNPALNAIIHQQFERALHEAEAELPTGRFTGVPMVFKDAGAQDEGEPFCCGLQPARDQGYRSQVTSPVAAAFRAAGFVPIGRTNTAELASKGTTEPAAFGPTRNPWATDHAPGGSSGGSAAAVAARYVAVGHATDIAGSIRIPASHCGVVGLKPSRGRALADGVSPAIGMHCEGAVVRSVRDAAAVADLLERAASSPFRATTPRESTLVGALKAPHRLLSIGICTSPFNGASVDPHCVAAATAAATVLESRGHTLVMVEPQLLREEALHNAMRIAMAANTDADLRQWSERLGRELGSADVEPQTWHAIEYARSLDPADLVLALGELERGARSAAAWWSSMELDVLITPTTAEAPPALDPTQQGYQPGRSSAFTRVFNATGQPAISLPLGWPSDGLPRGVQLIAAHGREDLLISAAAQLESELSWADRRPPGTPLLA